MKEEKVTAQDMEFDPPSSLKELVQDELNAINYDDFLHHKEVKPVTGEVVEQLMEKVYEHIESQALETFKSNAPWALKAWAFSNILRDTVASEATVRMADELMSPVTEWQNKQPFDPIKYFIDKLDKEHKSGDTKDEAFNSISQKVTWCR